MTKVHGMYGTPTYNSWAAMHGRCRGSKSKPERYVGRGITVCERWRTFEQFYADIGLRPVGMTLDRIDSDGGYHPGNCRWATPMEQGANRSGVVLITFNGETLSARQWAQRVGISDTTVRRRFRLGWPVEKVLSPDDFHCQSGRRVAL